MGLAERARGADQAFPFHAGEKLTFQLKWCLIPAGEAVLEVLPIETLDGVKAYHFLMLVKTYPFVDLFYEVRDRIDAYTDFDLTHSLLYRKKQREGKTKRDVVVSFDWGKKEAQYSNLGEKRKPIPILPGSFDPLSILYAFRLHEMEGGREVEIPVTDGKKAVMEKVKILEKTRVELASGAYQTYLVRPELKHISGVFEKSREASLEMWITADQRRLPVKVKSKVIVGSFTAELISAEMTGQGGNISAH